MSSIKNSNVGAKIDGIVINDLDTSKDSYYNYNSITIILQDIIIEHKLCSDWKKFFKKMIIFL